MDKNEFTAQLAAESLSLLVSKWVTDRTPFLFKDDAQMYLQWKEQLSVSLGVDSRAMIITGSASCGFSLSPLKNYRKFTKSSDIDVAIVSHHFFEICWKTLRSIGTQYYSLTPAQQIDVEEHTSRYIYWGTIATDKLLPIFPFGKEWNKALEEASRISPADGRDVKVRLYRDFESIRAYHLRSFRDLRAKILSTTA